MQSIIAGKSDECGWALLGLTVAIAGLCVAVAPIAASMAFITTAEAAGVGFGIFSGGLAGRSVFMECF